MVEWILGVIIVICIVTFIMYWKGWIESAKVGWGAFLIGLVTTGIGGYLAYKEFTPEGQLEDRQQEVAQLNKILVQAQSDPSTLLKYKSFLKDNGALTNAEISALERGTSAVDVRSLLTDIQETIAEKKVEMGKLSKTIDANVMKAKEALKQRATTIPRTPQSAIKKNVRKTTRRDARVRRGGADEESSSSEEEDMVFMQP